MVLPPQHTLLGLNEALTISSFGWNEPIAIA